MATAVRLYAAGAVTDVVPTANWLSPESLAQSLMSGTVAFQGTTGVYVCLSGATTDRPTPTQFQSNIWNKAIVGTKFFDTTLNKLIIYDGAGRWYDPATGALA
jgi:hypothetical protein